MRESAELSGLELDCVRAADRIRPHVRETPLTQSQRLSQLANANVLLKLESLQETGSFKLRGATNRMLTLPRSDGMRGVVTASNGNHALAVATIGAKLNVPVEVFVSASIDASRVACISKLGATVTRVAGDSLMAEVTARVEGARTARVYISPYNDIRVVEGQGTVAVELMRHLPGLDAVFVAVGGGGLIGGIGTHVKKLMPHVEIVACWPENAPALHQCLRAGHIVAVPESETLSVSTAGGVEPGAITFDLARRCIDRHVLVSEAQILEALRSAYRDDSVLAEGAAGVALAGFRSVAAAYEGRTVAIVVCGGNAGDALIRRICDDDL